MELTTSVPTFNKQAGYIRKFSDCLSVSKNKSITEWTIDQLDIRPYQHILEIGYASGYTLQEVARKLKIGFLAGIDESVAKYQQAYRRNKKLIHDQLLQLHIGSIHELPYPHHYFHTIYGDMNSLHAKEPQYALLQLSNMLRPGGKLVMVTPVSGIDAQHSGSIANNMKHLYLDAGLQSVRIEHHDLGIAAFGIKGFAI